MFPSGIPMEGPMRRRGRQYQRAPKNYRSIQETSWLIS